MLLTLGMNGNYICTNNGLKVEEQFRTNKIVGYHPDIWALVVGRCALHWECAAWVVRPLSWTCSKQKTHLTPKDFLAIINQCVHFLHLINK